MTNLWNALYHVNANVEYLLVLALVFAAATLSVGAGALVFINRKVLRERLARLTPTPRGTAASLVGAADPDAEGGFIARAVKPLQAAAAPAGEDEAKKVRLFLVQAGFRSRNALRNYLALRTLCAGLFPLIYLFWAAAYAVSITAVAVAVFLAGAGLYLPPAVVAFRRARRYREISRALPDALDLMVVCAESGLGLDMTLNRVGEEIRPLSPHLSDELGLTTMFVRAGKSRADAFNNLTRRVALSEMNNLVAVLNQASRFGTSIAQALRVHSDDLRLRRKQLAEEKAGKLVVMMLFPLVFFIFPALFVVLLGPAGIQVARILLPALGGGGGG